MKKLVALLLLLGLAFAFTVNAAALHTGFDATPLGEDEVRPYRAKVIPLDEEPKAPIFTCFAANKDGRIAVGSRGNSNEVTICVYKPDGSFDYGFTTTWHRGIRFEVFEDSVTVIDPSERYLFEVDRMGTIVAAARYDKTAKNDGVLNAATADVKSFSGTIYEAKSIPFPISFFFIANNNDKIVKTENGTTVTVYEADYLGNNVWFCIGAILLSGLFAGVVILFCRAKFRAAKKHPVLAEIGIVESMRERIEKNK